jgi:hypothetical protein
VEPVGVRVRVRPWELRSLKVSWVPSPAARQRRGIPAPSCQPAGLGESAGLLGFRTDLRVGEMEQRPTSQPALLRALGANAPVSQS